LLTLVLFSMSTLAIGGEHALPYKYRATVYKPIKTSDDMGGYTTSYQVDGYERMFLHTPNSLDLMRARIYNFKVTYRAIARHDADIEKGDRLVIMSTNYIVRNTMQSRNGVRGELLLLIEKE